PRSLRRGRLPTIFRSQLDERLNCSRLPGRDGLILDVVGTITTTSNARFGHLGQIDSEYMRNILSRFKELRIEKPVEVYGLPMPPDLRVSPFNLPDAVAHETRGTIQNRLGVPLYDTVMNRLAEAPTLDHKISVIQSFIETYFRYDLNATNFSPTRDPLWLSAFLRHQIGVCEHFSRFAQLLLALDQPGTRVASVEVLACDSNQLHEKLLIEDRSSTRFIEMTPPDRAQSLLSQCFSALRQFLPSSSTPLSREFFETFTRDCKILENTDLFRSVFHESNLPKIIDRIVQGERNALNALANKFNEEVKSLTSLVEPLETVTGSRQAKRETDWRNIFTISDAIIVLSPYIFKLLMALISPGIVRLLAKVSPVRQPEDYFSTLRLTGHVRRMGLLIPHKPGPKDWANWRMVRFAKIAETFTPTRLLTQSAIDQLGLTLSDVASAFVAQTARVQLVSTPALIPALRKEVAYHYLGLIGDTTLVPCGATSVVGAPELVMRVDKERTKEELEPKIAAFLNSIFERFTDLNSVVIDRDQYSTMSLLAFAVLYEPKMIYELARRGYRMDMDFDIRQVISAAKVTEESSLHAAGTYRIRAALKALIELGYPLDRDTRRTSSETTSLLCKYLRLESDDSPLVSALIAAGHPISTAADHMKHSSTGALYNWVYNRDDGTIFSAMSISGRFDQPDIGMQSLDGGRKDGPLYSSLERLIKNRDFFGGLIHVLAADYPVAMDPGNQPNRITLLDRAILNMDLEAATWLAQRGAIISSPRSFFAFVTDKGENSTGIWGWLITRDLKLVALCMQAIYRRFTMANSNSATLS
ncbi:hypothetical protein EBR96_06535, partial [bacterium]|nr:hypothetical protein [bacterium]